MKCPNDSTTLVMTERSGVEIDYCPDCRGVWLDRGELDKILDRAEKEFAQLPPHRCSNTRTRAPARRNTATVIGATTTGTVATTIVTGIGPRRRTTGWVNSSARRARLRAAVCGQPPSGIPSPLSEPRRSIIV